MAFSFSYTQCRPLRASLFVIGVLTLIAVGSASALCEPANGVKLAGPESRRPASEPSYILDGQQYWQDRLIYDFLQTAFSHHLWMEDTLDPPRALAETQRRWKDPDPGYPWASAYLFPEKGYPRYDVVNRWSKDLTVGLGWPPVVPESSNDVSRVRAAYNTGRSDDPKSAELIKNQILLLAPQITTATGHSIRFIEPSDETPAHYAHIRIVTTGDFFIDNKFKTNREHSAATGESDATRFDNMFADAVRFTPYARDQVDGYFVPDKDNNIDFAVCKIWPRFHEDLFKSLVNECLARALGLPETSALNDRAAIGHWNVAHDVDSQRAILDGPKANPETHMLFLQLGDQHATDPSERDKSYLRLKEQLDKFSDERTDSNAMLSRLTEYDMAMLSLLYCKQLAPGMDKGAVMRTLYSHLPECLTTFSKGH